MWCHDIQHNDSQHNDTRHNSTINTGNYTLLNALKLLSCVSYMLIVTNKPIMLGVVMPNVVTLNFVAPRMFIPRYT
jgi:hypothetical protein